MRWLCGTEPWGLCPQTPRIYRFFSARMEVFGLFQGAGSTCPSPFRPLNRSLRLLPSRALSRPVQVIPGWTTSTSPCNDSSANGDSPLTSCLTPGVHFSYGLALPGDVGRRFWGVFLVPEGAKVFQLQPPKGTQPTVSCPWTLFFPLAVVSCGDHLHSIISCLLLGDPCWRCAVPSSEDS